MFGGHEELTLAGGVKLSTGSYYVQLGDTRLHLQYPSAGYGGSELVVSHDERTAVMFVYSGQSDVGYELFRIDPARGQIEHIGGMPYVGGEGDAPVLSPDGRWLAMLASCGPYDRETGEWLEDSLDPYADERDELEVDVARLFVQEIPAVGAPGEIADVFVGATIRRNADYDAIASWDVYETVSFSPTGKLVLAPKWAARVELDVPLRRGEITLQPFDVAYLGID